MGFNLPILSGAFRAGSTAEEGGKRAVPVAQGTVNSSYTL